MSRLVRSNGWLAFLVAGLGLSVWNLVFLGFLVGGDKLFARCFWPVLIAVNLFNIWAALRNRRRAEEREVVEQATSLAPSVLAQSALARAQVASHMAIYSRFVTLREAFEPEHDLTRTEPFVGWKSLGIVVRDKAFLLGVGGVPYGVDATAVCNRAGMYAEFLVIIGPPTHTAPEWHCTCGFYALAERCPPEYGRFRAQVELFGTVIEAERGWRASRQRVLSLEAFRTCQQNWKSSHPEHICGSRADGFAVDQDGTVWPACAKHAPLGLGTLAELSALVGTEVRWTDPGMTLLALALWLSGVSIVVAYTAPNAPSASPRFAVVVDIALVALWPLLAIIAGLFFVVTLVER